MTTKCYNVKNDFVTGMALAYIEMTLDVPLDITGFYDDDTIEVSFEVETSELNELEQMIAPYV